MKNCLRHKAFPLVFFAMLTGFTAYVLLDTFVIPRSYAEVAEDGEATVATEDASGSAQDSAHSRETDATQTTTTLQDSSEEDAQVSSGAESGRSDGGRPSVDGQRTGMPAHDTSRPGHGGPYGPTSSAEPNDSTAAQESTGSVNTQTQQAQSPDTQETSASDSGSVELSTQRINNTTVYVAEVTLGSATGLKAAFANNTYGKNVKAPTSQIAEQNGATLAINGDFYGARNAGYVIRNGVLYRSTGAGNEDLVIYQDGSWEIVEENEVSAQELLDRGAWQVFSFGPALVEDGQVQVSSNEEVGQAMASNPRTALGIVDATHYVLVVSDGRTNESEGLSLYELAQLMQSLGAQCAYNLDGGGSSTMVYNGQVVNNPTTSGNRTSERSVSDIVYIA